MAASRSGSGPPEPSGVEVSGFHPDLEHQLEQLGYLGDDKP